LVDNSAALARLPTHRHSRPCILTWFTQKEATHFHNFINCWPFRILPLTQQYTTF